MTEDEYKKSLAEIDKEIIDALGFPESQLKSNRSPSELSNIVGSPLEELCYWLGANNNHVKKLIADSIIVNPTNIRTYKGRAIFHPSLTSRCKRQYKRHMRRWNKASEYENGSTIIFPGR